MCGIVCAWGNESKKFVLNGLDSISSRGKDGCGIVTDFEQITALKPKELNCNLKESSYAMGHLLHAMNDVVVQPLYGKGVFVFNGEIYNWRELSKKYDINARNDSELLFFILEQTELLNEKSLDLILDELDGPFAFVYYRDSKIILSRDIFGIKPLFYNSSNSSLQISSEKKLFDTFVEVLPGESIFVSLNDFKINSYIKRLTLPKLKDISYENAEDVLWDLLKKSVRKRVPKNKKIGVLFSGGIDSTVLVLILKELGIEFTCYTAEVIGGNIEQASDLVFAKELAQIYDLDLQIATHTVDELEQKTLEVMSIVGDSDYIKTSVALPFHLCAQKAEKNGVSTLFSGLGSEELFAGYRRHRKVEDIRSECLRGLEIMYQRDLYRDDVVTMAASIELRVPFLDKELVNFALSLPANYLLNEDKSISKLILRTTTKRFTNLEDKYSFRQKKAAQYGSKFDKGLLRLAKNNDLGKQDYLDWLWDSNFDKKRPQKIWY